MQVTGRSFTSSITEKNLLQFLLVFFLLFPLWLFWFFAFSFMTHLNGHLKLFMLLLELLCLCQAARDGEAGHQHGLRVLDPSHHLEMKHERPPKRKTKSIFTCVASAWKVASWTHCSSLIRRMVARSSMSTARSWWSSTLKDQICLIF